MVKLADSFVSQVLVNGELQSEDMIVPTAGGCALTITIISPRLLIIISENLGLDLMITTSATSMFVNLQISQNSCCGMVKASLCGSCTCPGPSVTQPCGLEAGTSNVTTNSSDILPGDSNESIKNKINKAQISNGLNTININNLGPGNSLCFDKASVLSRNLQLFNGRFTTIEFFIRACKSCFGTILSYTVTSTFALHHGPVLSISYGNVDYPSKLSLDDMQWNQVVVVFDKVSLAMDLYLFNKSGSLTRDQIILDADPFETSGSFVLGKWQPSNDGTGRYKPLKFVGCLDELRIWNRYAIFPLDSKYILKFNKPYLRWVFK